MTGLEESVWLLAPAVTFESPYPLELASLAAALLRRGFGAFGIDLRVEPDGLEKRLSRGLAPGPRAIVVEASIRNVAEAVRLGRSIRSRGWRPVLFTGTAAAIADGFFLAAGAADVEVTGDAEDVVPALLERLPVREGVPGARFPGDGGHVSPAPPRFGELDAFGSPDRHVFPWRGYATHALRAGHLQAPILASRGCRLECAFCPVPERYRRAWRARSPDAVVDEMARLQRDHGIDTFLFEDEQPLQDRAWFSSVLGGGRRHLPRARIELKNGLRGDLLDGELLQEMAASGVRRIALGVESGSSSARERLRRPLDEGHLARVIDLCRRRGVAVTGYYLTGLPEETALETLATLRSMREHRWSYAHLSVFCPWRPLGGLAARPRAIAVAVRTGAYLSTYAKPSRLLDLVRLGDIDFGRPLAAPRRFWAWLLSGSKGGGGW